MSSMSSAPDMKYATIEDLAVREDIRSKGIGAKIVEWLDI